MRKRIGWKGKKMMRVRTVKVFICSRTQKQLSQMVSEFKGMKSEKEVHMTQLGSREFMCLDKNVLASRNMADAW